MDLNLTPDQSKQLEELGILSKPTTNISENIKEPHNSSLNIGNLNPDQSISNPPKLLLNKSNFPIVPILSISGLTFLSFGGLVYFSTKNNDIPSTPNIQNTSPQAPIPTQVPKSIQHYLLASQQYFTQALDFQTKNDQVAAVENFNLSITTASNAITSFPGDYRAYEQRGRIYLSVIESQPQLLSYAISDFAKASELNPNSAEITKTLASLYAKNGDAQNTLAYLSKTVDLEPTKAQNFYDLAHLQQQVGQLPQALDTYNRLLTIISDPNQKSSIEIEKSSLEKLVSKGPLQSVTPIPIPTINNEQPLLQASLANRNLIIASPETNPNITIKNQTSSNSLSDKAILPANTKSITITNNNSKSTSQIYVTISKGGKNQSLQVLSKSQNNFTVGLDSPINEDIEFTWWIVN